MCSLAMRCVVFGCSLLATLSATAQERRFPYNAVVDAATELVRCGPGLKYYVTGQLQRGDQVSVIRHDPGGWYMIAPPKGSFSWISADYVELQGGSRGIVTTNNVVVRIGSSQGEERDSFQRQLSRGDEVTVLGEQEFASELGPQLMLKIAPPAREYRWMLGKSLLPEGATPAPTPTRAISPGPVASPIPDTPATALRETSVDPFADDSTPTRAAALSTPQNSAATSVDATPVAAIEDFRTTLRTLDEQFGQMLQQEPPQWQLAPLEEQYRALEGVAASPAQRSQLSMRMDAVKRYAKIQQDYADFQQLTTETRQRDAELTAMQNQTSAQLASTGASEFVGENFQGDGSANMSAPTVPVPTAPVSAENPANPAPAGVPPRFDGAGILQRTQQPTQPGAPGLPPYVLLSTRGKLLSFVQPVEPLDLEPFVGRSIGLSGRRGRQPAWQADLIEARSASPVQLRP